MNDLKLKCWIVCEDGLTGTENQCLGVAQALGVEPVVKKIRLKEPWKSASPYLGFESACTFTPPLTPPWPDLLIAAGRKSIAASRYVKKISRGKTFTVQIQDPRISPKNFDLVAVPAHDSLRGENVIVTTATPNKITDEKLRVETQLVSELSDLPSPRLAVLIGGNSKDYMLTPEIAENMVEKLRSTKASLMVSVSRRTDEKSMLALKNVLQDRENVYFWNGEGENPYLSILALADYIAVTGDSASMLSDAATTGKPVYLLPLQPKSQKRTPRIDKLHQKLQDLNILRKFDGTLEEWDYLPLNDAVFIAEEIKKRINIK